MKTLKPIDIKRYSLEKAKIDKGRYMPLIFDLCMKMTPFEREDMFKMIKTEMGHTMQAIKDEFSIHQSQKGADRGSQLKIDGKIFKIPSGYIVDEKGISVLSDKGVEKITTQKVLIKDIGIDISTGFIYVDLSFSKYEIEQTKLVRKIDISSNHRIIELSNVGLDVHTGNSKLLVQYLIDFYNENENQIKKIEVISQLGWYKNTYNLPNASISKEGIKKPWFKEQEIKKIGYVKKGSLEKWISTMKNLHNLKDNTLMVFLLYAGFAAAIWEKIKRKTWTLHLFGPSSGGKSIALGVPASIYGYPDTNNGIIRRWSSTRTSIPRFLEELKNIPLFLDELSVNAEQNFQSLIYEFEGEISKGKSSLDNPLNTVPQRNWGTLIFSTGEIPLIRDAFFPGTTVRSLEFEGSPFREDNKKIVTQFKKDLMENCGWAIEPYIQEFFDFKWKEIEPFYADKGLNKMESRIMDQFDGFYIAGILAEKVFDFGFDPKQVVTSIFDELITKRRNEGDFVSNFIAFFSDYFNQHRNSFFNVDVVMGSAKTTLNSNFGRCLGYVFKSDSINSHYDIAISRSEFKNILKKWGNRNSERSLLNELLKRKYIISEKESFRIRKKIDGENKSLIYFPDFHQH